MLRRLTAAPLVPAALAFVAGVIAGRYVELPWTAFGAAAAGGWALGGLFLLHRRTWPVGGVALTIGLMGLGGAVAARQAVPRPVDDVCHLASEESPLYRLTGVVVTHPQGSVATGIDDVYSPGDRTRFEMTCRLVHASDGPRPARGRIRVVAYGEGCAVGYGDRVELTGRMRPPLRPTNEHQVDTSADRRARGVRASLIVSNAASVRVMARGEGNPLVQWIFDIKAFFGRCIDRALPPEAAGIVTCLVLGERHGVGREVNDAFRKSGTIHLLAVSGLHVGLVMAALYALASFMRVGFRWRMAAVIGVAIFFAVMTGGRASVVRASFMAVLVALGLMSGRWGSVTNVLAGAAMAILLVRPHDIANAGFQLSFLATLGLIFGAGPFVDAIDRLLLGHPLAPNDMHMFRWRRLAYRWVTGTVGAGLAASSAVMLVVAWHFGIASPLGIVLNIVLVPLVGSILVGAMLFLPLATLGHWIGLPIVAVAAGWPLRIFSAALVGVVTNTTEAFPVHRYVARPAIALMVLAFAWLMVLWWRRGSKRFTRRWIGAGLPAIVTLWILWPAPPRGHDDLEIVFFDVGSGIACYVELPDGRNFVYDCGSDSDWDVGEFVLGRYIWRRGVNRLDGVVVSHPHRDHCGGLPSLADRFGPGWALMTEYFFLPDTREADTARAVRRCLTRSGARLRTLRRGDRCADFGGLAIEAFDPPASLDGLSCNETSLVLKLTWGDVTILLPGDMEKAEMIKLIHGGNLDADVVLVPHHGSTHAHAGAFIRATTPHLAVVSADRDFRNKPTVALFKEAGCTLLETWRTGMVRIRTDGRTIRYETFHGEAGQIGLD